MAGNVDIEAVAARVFPGRAVRTEVRLPDMDRAITARLQPLRQTHGMNRSIDVGDRLSPLMFHRGAFSVLWPCSCPRSLRSVQLVTR